MSRLRNTRRIGFLAGALLLLVAIQGCSTDSPTAPEQVPAPPPSNGGNNWTITVKVNPQQLVAGSDVPSTVTAKVESRDDGSSPPNGTTMSFFTSIGEFGEMGSGVSNIAVVIDRGKATALLFAGDVVAGGTVEAHLEGSVGRKDFQVVSQETFITAVNPSSGPASGGTTVTIDGVNFRNNARVSFGGKLGTITSISSSRIVVRTPPGLLDTESCTTGGGEPGTRQIDTEVDILLEFADGGSESLPNGFTYLSPNTNCVAD